MRILVFGVSGMLGNAMFRYFADSGRHQVYGTQRSTWDLSYFPASLHENINIGIDALDTESVIRILSEIRPDVVINCIGLIKQLASAQDPLITLPLNALFPHRLARLCKLADARLVHISTDCVFSGRRGGYLESDTTDAEDLYGKSKQLGEVIDQKHAVTLRTSIIGHELHSHHALVDWFLSSGDRVNGFTRAIFSGLPTIELARVIDDHVLTDASLHGLYHVSADPIAKYDLLKLIAETYDKKVTIIPSDNLVIDRSLDSRRFKSATGYQPPSWPTLVKAMHNDYLKSKGLTDV